jgi:dynein light chain roadblock-type
LGRIKNHKSVDGIIIVNNEGHIVRSNYQPERKEEGDIMAKSIHQLTIKARSTVRDLDPTVSDINIFMIIFIWEIFFVPFKISY